jgi:hypothetical protein
MGGSFPLVDGCFVGCDPRVIQGGAWCEIVIANQVTETLRVQIDQRTLNPYVQSAYTVAGMIAKIGLHAQPPVVVS